MKDTIYIHLSITNWAAILGCAPELEQVAAATKKYRDDLSDFLEVYDVEPQFHFSSCAKDNCLFDFDSENEAVEALIKQDIAQFNKQNGYEPKANISIQLGVEEWAKKLGCSPTIDDVDAHTDGYIATLSDLMNTVYPTIPCTISWRLLEGSVVDINPVEEDYKWAVDAQGVSAEEVENLFMNFMLVQAKPELV